MSSVDQDVIEVLNGKFGTTFVEPPPYQRHPIYYSDENGVSVEIEADFFANYGYKNPLKERLEKSLQNVNLSKKCYKVDGDGRVTITK